MHSGYDAPFVIHDLVHPVWFPDLVMQPIEQSYVFMCVSTDMTHKLR